MSEEEVRVIELHEDLTHKNDIDAMKLRAKMKKEKTLLVNIMSSPGAGKTTLLRSLIRRMKDKYDIAVMEADIDSDVDALRIREEGVDSVQVHTGGCCHLSADMTEQGLAGFNGKHYDLIFLENVGNLVCPAEFDTGATLNVMLLSVPEGADKPLKYPLMFRNSDLLVITKTDVMKVFDFSLENCEKWARDRHPGMEIIPVSAKTGDNMDKLVSYFEKKIEKQRA